LVFTDFLWREGRPPPIVLLTAQQSIDKSPGNSCQKET
jgi:hypothetical protein